MMGTARHVGASIIPHYEMIIITKSAHYGYFTELTSTPWYSRNP